MARMFSTKLSHHPEIAAMALEMYFGRMSRSVLEEWAGMQGEVVDDEESPF
jgi:hypothetical protein